MLGWMIILVFVAAIAGLFGFGGLGALPVGLARGIFFIAIALLAISALIALIRGRTRVPRHHPVVPLGRADPPG